MLTNYFKVAWRNLVKNKVYSSINILGLAAGLTITILIGLWITDETSFDRNFANYNRIVRVLENSTHSGSTQSLRSIPIPLGPELRTKYGSDFKRVALASWLQPNILANGDKKISRDGMFAEPDFPAIFSLKMIKGNWHCIDDPSSIVLSRSTATTLFGDADPVNKTIKFNNKSVLKVSGVYEDLPYNCEFRDLGFLTPWAFYVADRDWVKNSANNWDNNSFQLYAQLADNAGIEQVNAKIKGGLEGHDRKDKPEVLLHAMPKWHLYGEFKDGRNTGGSIQFVWMFGLIGGFVLLLACINFMNLSTARSERRAREVGIRKAVGSLRTQLIIQFLCESVMIAAIALCLAILLTELALPWFNQLADKKIILPWSNPIFWLATLCFTLFTGLISGSYPALYLSSFSSIKVLKGSFRTGRFASIPRKALVVLQFTVSVSLIIGTIVVYTQIQYAKDRPVNYARAGLIRIDMNTPDLYGHYQAMRDDLLRTGAVTDMAESSSPTTSVWSNQSSFDWRGKPPGLFPSFGVIGITHDFGRTIGWKFAQGRDFSRDFPSDSNGIILNEAAAKFMGFTDPLKETVRYFDNSPEKHLRVLGVVKDMVMESPFEPIKPTVFLIDYNWGNVILVKLDPKQSPHETLPRVEAVFKKYNPGAPFEYKFEDTEYATKFGDEERISSLATFFAAFAIFISCLGLFGLAAFTAEQRTKEIGVRKVLGASTFNLWGLLSRDFVGLVALSFLIAIPLACYAMNKWLENYSYHTQISAVTIIMTAAGALLITLATVSFQTIRAALSNPVKSLRSE
ncbi:ABC transporter permease [Puia sp. P3]|uniref:ABC transporter permease n=1 Tax=Puia sp. P3 TaxID=3423952 RepID=UPI003D66D433